MQTKKTYTFEIEITGRCLDTNEALAAFSKECTDAGLDGYEPLMKDGKTYLRCVYQDDNADDALAKVTRDIESLNGVHVKRDGDLRIDADDWQNLMEKLQGTSQSFKDK
ncbi:hypothetical protein M9194_04065 [Vibrio sp. S4M6]|nr:hypothetical protein [Vibrio sinus]MCL9780610.1 hypothetical protein [Vibrio sinus]